MDPASGAPDRLIPFVDLFRSGGELERSDVSAQAKPMSEVVNEFEQSLGNLRPSTRRVYVAAAKTAIRSAHLDLWQCPSTGELLASLGKSPIEKKGETHSLRPGETWG